MFILPLILIINCVLCINNLSLDVLDMTSEFLTFEEQRQVRLLTRSRNTHFINKHAVISSLSQISLFIASMHHFDNSSISKMKEITKQLILHPKFISKLSFWIGMSWKRLSDNDDNNLFGVEDFEHVMDILNTHSIAFCEIHYESMNGLADALKLLVLVSRGFVQYLAPTFSAHLEIKNEPILEEVIWMAHEMDMSWIPFFCYVYQDLIENQLKLSINPNNSIYYFADGDPRKQQILDLTEKHGFIMWDKATIDQFISTYYKQNYGKNMLEFIAEFREYDELFFDYYFAGLDGSINRNDLASNFIFEMQIDYENGGDFNQLNDTVAIEDCLEYLEALCDHNEEQRNYMKLAVFNEMYTSLVQTLRA